jgi:hypothetical protein
MRFIVAALSLSLAPVASAGPRQIDKQLSQFEQTTGVEITAPRRDEMGKRRGPISEKRLAESLPVLEEVVMTYDQNLRGELLKQVRVYGKLRGRSDKAYLGLARPKKGIFDIGIRGPTSMASVRATTHHEIAHLVLPALPGFADQWKQISDGDYRGKGAAKTGRLGLHSDGFVSTYGSKNPHEDFAEYAEMAFTRPQRLLALADKHAKVATKLKLMDAAYRQVSPDAKRPWDGAKFRRITRRET